MTAALKADAGGTFGSLQVNGVDVLKFGAGAVGDPLEVAKVPDLAAYSKRTLTAAVATTSGTFVDFTGIPSWAKKITVLVNGVTTSGASNLLVQLGTSGGVQNTGYVCSYGYLSATPATTTTTAGFGVTYGAGAGVIFRGRVGLELQDATTGYWVPNAAINMSGGGAIVVSVGGKALSGTLDRVRITTANGTDTFTAGSISLLIEG